MICDSNPNSENDFCIIKTFLNVHNNTSTMCSSYVIKTTLYTVECTSAFFLFTAVKAIISCSGSGSLIRTYNSLNLIDCQHVIKKHWGDFHQKELYSCVHHVFHCS